MDSMEPGRVRAGKLDVVVVDSSKSSLNSARALARGGIDGLLVRGTDTGVRQKLRFVNVCRCGDELQRRDCQT
jgi:hypothetical protein